jgi:hypothetical protein
MDRILIFAVGILKLQEHSEFSFSFTDSQPI